MMPRAMRISRIIGMLVMIESCCSIAPPLVTSVAPNSGNVLGGQRVEISVDNFRPADNYACRFDAYDVEARYDNKKRKILCVAPPHKAGTVYVEVGVQSVFSFASGIMFTYEPPFLFSIYPSKGPAWGEIPVTISGVNFKNLDDRGKRDIYVRYQCRFVGTSFGTLTRPAAMVDSLVNPLVPVTTQMIWCYVPASQPGSCVGVEISMGGTLWDRTRTPPVPEPYVVFSSESNLQYCYERPTITSMWPVKGPMAGNTLLRITGLSLQPSESARCFFINEEVGFARHSAMSTATFQKKNSLKLSDFSGVENDTEAIFCRTPQWRRAVVKVYLDLDGQLSENYLNFTFFAARVTRLFPPHVAAHGGTLVYVYGVNFENVTYPRCRFSSARYAEYIAETVSIVEATFISSNVVICRAPSRRAARLPHGHPHIFVDPAEINNKPWLEHVQVNTQKGSSYAMKLNGFEDHLTVPFHRSLVIFGDVTLEAWMKFENVVDGTSPIWFGLTDENVNARYLYGIFIHKRAIPHGTSNMTSNTTYVADIEIGHSRARFGDGYSGQYNFSWPLSKESPPPDASKIFRVGLHCGYWHHIAAVKNFSASQWILYINGSVVGTYYFGTNHSQSTSTPDLRDFRIRLEEFFIEYDPFQRWRVHEWLSEYKGREEEMFEELKRIYPAAGTDKKTNLPGNLNRQDLTIENFGASYKDPKDDRQYLNAGGVDPRTRTSPYLCDPRIHKVSVCLLPWGATGHHTVANLFIGRGGRKYQNHHGWLDDVRLWNIARSAQQIAENFVVELGGTETGLTAYYPFSEGSGVMAYDISKAQQSSDTNDNNAHLLGYPKQMWCTDDLLSAFIEQNCPHCAVTYTPSVQLCPPGPTTTFTLPHNYTDQAILIDQANPSAQTARNKIAQIPASLHIPASGTRPYTYQSAIVPLRYGLSPSRGPIHGGTVVTIHGRGFMEGPGLQCRFQGTVSRQGGQFQGTGLVDGKYLNESAISCVSPAHTFVGNTSLYVSNDGDTFNTDPQIFEYSKVVPRLHSISVQPGPLVGHRASYCPVRTPLTGGTMITIHGENFMQSDSTQLLLFRMGEMPALPVHEYIDNKTIIIKAPPINTRFWGDTDFGAMKPDGYPLPQSYGYPSPHPLREMRSGTSAENNFNIDPRYHEWGQGKPFDCSRDAPGTRCYRPAFTVRVTNDGGRQWSDFPPYKTTIDNSQALESRSNCVFYSDLIVSPDGDDDTGDGTFTRPFRSPKKAAEWAHGDGDRILMFRGNYAPAMMQELFLSPKRLVVYQDAPLRTDQGGDNAGPLSELCKCHDHHGKTTKTLCKCENDQGLPSVQPENAIYQRQHSNHDEFSRSQQNQYLGQIQVDNMLDGQFETPVGQGEASVDIFEGMAHADHMGFVDSYDDL